CNTWKNCHVSCLSMLMPRWRSSHLQTTSPRGRIDPINVPAGAADRGRALTRGPASGRCRDGKAHHLVPGNEASNHPRRLGLLDEGVQERSSGRVLARRADSLLHGGELTIKD